MATFTDYDALLASMLNDLAAGGAFITKSYTFQGDTRIYRSLKELKEGIAWLEEKAAADGAIRGRKRVTVANFRR